MYRTFVILRHTFLEAIVQPIYPLLLAIGSGVLVIFALLPFFTLGEDTAMFKSVSLDVVLLFVLVSTLFATSQSIFEEIEDRTMLTLMSKPVSKWEVLVGKYLGIICSAALAIAILGAILILCTWWRIPGDNQLRTSTLDDRELKLILDTRLMNIAGLVPALVLIWFQISVLAAVSVAISVRMSLVVNLPVVILLYIAGNLMRFLFPLSQGPLANSSWLAQKLAYLLSLVLPFLAIFDLRDKTVLKHIALGNSAFAHEIGAVPLSEIWQYVAVAGLNALCYSVFALAIGMLLFQSRELGGAEG
jgi:ABC-type transport system involved in multi-copper enzyme maturation permease subunit